MRRLLTGLILGCALAVTVSAMAAETPTSDRGTVNTMASTGKPAEPKAAKPAKKHHAKKKAVTGTAKP